MKSYWLTEEIKAYDYLAWTVRYADAIILDEQGIAWLGSRNAGGQVSFLLDAVGDKFPAPHGWKRKVINDR